MSEQKNKDINNKVRNFINSPNNSDKISSIIQKMGKLLSKKQLLQHETPILVYGDRIWLGNYAYANNKQFIQSKNIKHIVSCLEIPLNVTLSSVNYKKFSIKDNEDNQFELYLKQFYQFIENSQGSIFVHCFSGKSRSVAFILSYIMRKQQLSFEMAFQKLVKIYPLAQPNRFFIDTLKAKQNEFIVNNSILDMHMDLLGQPQYQVKQLVLQEKHQNLSSHSPKKQQINLLQQITSNHEDLLDISELSGLTSTKEVNLLEEAIPESDLINSLIEHKQVDLQNQVIFLEQSKTQTHQNLIEFGVENRDKDLMSFSQQQGTQTIKIQLTDFKNENQNEFRELEKEKPENIQETEPKQQKTDEKEDEFIEQADFSQKKNKKKKKHKK